MTTPRRALSMLDAGWWLGYLALLAPVVAYAVVRFAPLYPADSLATEPELSRQYKAFVGLSGFGLAVFLGIGAAAYGAWRASVWRGAAALALGAATTVAALSVVPMVRFPEDQYPPAALWVMADLPALAVAFVVATLAGRLIARGREPEPRTTG
jgi:hypothetical protein